MKGGKKSKTRRQGDKEKRSGKPPASAPWDPSIPLPGGKGKHERVVQAVLKGLDATNAYRSQYGGSVQVAQAAGSRLLLNVMVKARLAWLQKQVADKVLAEVPITKIEGVKRIFDGLDFTIVDIANAVNKQAGADGEGAQDLTPEERRAALLCEEMSMTRFGPKYKATSWIRRLGEIGDILGWKKQEVNVSGKLEVSGLDAIVERVRGQPFEVKFTGGKAG